MVSSDSWASFKMHVRYAAVLLSTIVPLFTYHDSYSQSTFYVLNLFLNAFHGSSIFYCRYNKLPQNEGVINTD